MSDKSDKLKALETAIGQIERQFGKGSVMRMGERPQVRVNVIPTGSINATHSIFGCRLATTGDKCGCAGIRRAISRSGIRCAIMPMDVSRSVTS